MNMALCEMDGRAGGWARGRLMGRWIVTKSAHAFKAFIRRLMRTSNFFLRVAICPCAWIAWG